MENLITLSINKENKDYMKSLLETKYKGLTYKGCRVYVANAFHTYCGQVDVVPMFAYWDNSRPYKDNEQVLSYENISFDPVSLKIIRN